MKIEIQKIEPAKKVQKESTDFNQDEMNSILNSIQQMDCKLEKVYQDIVNISDRLSNSIQDLQIISSLIEDGFINNPHTNSNELSCDDDDELEAMKIFYNMEKEEHLFFQFLTVSNQRASEVTRSKYVREGLAKEIGRDQITLYKSIKKKLGTQSHDELIKKGRRLLKIVDDYSYSVYSGGLSKDYVEKMIGCLANETSLAA